MAHGFLASNVAGGEVIPKLVHGEQRAPTLEQARSLVEVLKAELYAPARPMVLLRAV